MTDEITPKTLDLASALAGRTFATDKVDVYLDEETAYEVARLNSEIKRATVLDAKDDLEQFENDLKALTAKGAESRLTFHVTTVPRHVRKAILDSVLKEYPNTTDFLGRAVTDPEADEIFANRSWATHIRKIVGADGSERVQPDEGDIKIFRDNAPDVAIEAVEKAIQELSEGAKAGVETLIQEHDFLSQP